MAMMSFGLFVFELKTTPYQQQQHQLEWRHPSNSRVGKRPARQYAGQGDETINLSGILYPELTGGPVNLDKIRDMADTGQAYALIDGTGRILGQFVVERLSTTQTVFFQDGTARKIEFDLKLTRVDDDRVIPTRRSTA